MPTTPSPGEGPDAEVIRAFRELITGMDLADLRAVTGEVLAWADGHSPARRARPTPRPSRRHERRVDEVRLRVRVDLDDSHPPIWRLLELSSAMFLDELHAVLQVAFGWTDSHLHRFALGESVWDEDAEKFLCPYDVEEGDDDGVPAAEVRIDEVLAEPGDLLRYAYDYGDGWELRIRLEAVAGRDPGAPRATCTGGRRAAPPEDCGGIHAYDEMVSDPGSGVDDAFDPHDVDEALNLEAQLTHALDGLPDVLATMLRRATGSTAYDLMAALVLEADLGSPVEIGAVEAAEMVRRYAWLLDRVGPAGIKLTAAGYLPPVHVEAAFEALGLADEWIGKGNREDQTVPVLVLRESATRLGLLRKYRGTLLLTKAGTSVREDPSALWWYVARRLPLEAAGSIEHHVALLSLLGTAAGWDVTSSSFRSLTASVLSRYGWHVDGGPLAASNLWAVRDLSTDVLRQMETRERDRRTMRRGTPTPGGRLLARAVLQHQAATQGR